MSAENILHVVVKDQLAKQDHVSRMWQNNPFRLLSTLKHLLGLSLKQDMQMSE